jgi:hypothetical protein
LFGVEGMHILDVTRDPDVGGGQVLVVLDVESDADLTAKVMISASVTRGWIPTAGRHGTCSGWAFNRSSVVT